MNYDKPLFDWVVYTKEGCGYCAKAKKLLTDKGIVFAEIEITDKNINYIYSKIDNHTKTYRYFPIIFNKHKFIGGFVDIQKYFKE